MIFTCNLNYYSILTAQDRHSKKFGRGKPKTGLAVRSLLINLKINKYCNGLAFLYLCFSYFVLTILMAYTGYNWIGLCGSKANRLSFEESQFK